MRDTPLSFEYGFKTLILLKCTSSAFAQNLLKGELFLNTPQMWVAEEKKGNKGQGDLLEGTIITVPAHDTSPYVKALLANPFLDHFYYH